MRILFFTLITLYLSLFAVSVARAVELEVSYPSVDGKEFIGGGPLVWLEYLFTGAIALIGIVAFISLVVAGIQWMTSRNPGSISSAKDRITGTILGLILAGASFLILFLINPDLVNLSIPSITIPDAPSTVETGGGVELGSEGSVGVGKLCQFSGSCQEGLWCPPASDLGFQNPGLRKCTLKQSNGTTCSQETAAEQCLSGFCNGDNECARLPANRQPGGRDNPPEFCDINNSNSCPFPLQCVASGPFTTVGTCEEVGIDDPIIPSRVPPEDSTISQPTNLTISGPLEVYQDGSQPTYTFTATVSPGETVEMHALVLGASLIKSVIADAQGVALINVPPILPNLCTAGTQNPDGSRNETVSGEEARLQAARISPDGKTRSPWAFQTFSILKRTRLCNP